MAMVNGIGPGVSSALIICEGFQITITMVHMSRIFCHPSEAWLRGYGNFAIDHLAVAARTSNAIQSQA
jgi:hypothetical protein